MAEQTSSSSLRRSVNYYTGLLRRYELLVLIVVFAGTLLGGTASFYIPSIYEARTIFLMEHEGVDNPITKDSNTASQLREKLQTINEVVLSRQFLLRVIDKLNLDASLKSNAEVEELIQKMRLWTSVRSRSRSYDVFEITYRDADPQQAQAVNASMADMFIEDNLEFVRRQQNAALNFIEDQLLEYKKRLEESEKRLREFKEVNIGEMPGQENAALTGLERYQVELEKVHLELREAQLQEAALKKQLSEEKPMVVSISSRNGLSSLEGLKLRLAQLLTRYTEHHPDVIQVTRALEQLKKEPKPEKLPAAEAGSEIATLNPMYQKLREDLMGVSRKIATLKDQQEIYKKKIKSYKLKVTAVPRKEQELTRLQRDYNVNNGIYQLLLQRLAEAQITRELNITQRGERFTILEPATVPIFPVKPNRPKIFLFSLFISGIMGAGVLVLKDSLDDSLKSVADARAYLQVPVVAIIPDIPMAKTLWRKRILRWTIITVGTVSLIALGALIVLNDQRLWMKVSTLLLR